MTDHPVAWPTSAPADLEAEYVRQRINEGIISEDEARAVLLGRMGYPPDQARWDEFAHAPEPQPWWRTLARRLGRRR